jgi:hypothetical protein
MRASGSKRVSVSRRGDKGCGDLEGWSKAHMLLRQPRAKGEREKRPKPSRRRVRRIGKRVGGGGC